jgi:hypothetical protein
MMDCLEKQGGIQLSLQCHDAAVASQQMDVKQKRKNEENSSSADLTKAITGNGSSVDFKKYCPEGYTGMGRNNI